MTNKETPNLETQIAKLEDEASRLHGKAIATQYIPDKEVLIKKRARIIKSLSKLKEKRNILEENEAPQKVDVLFNKHKQALVIDVNGIRVTLSDKLTIPLTYTPCKHKHDLHIKEILRFQRNIKLEKVLLAKWQSLLDSSLNMEAKFNCSQCRREQESRFEKLRRRKDTPTGTCTVRMRKL